MIVFISQTSLFLLHQCVLDANTIPYIQLFASWAYSISNTCMVHYCAVRKDSRLWGQPGWEAFRKGQSRCLSVLREFRVNSDWAWDSGREDRGLPVRFSVVPSLRVRMEKVNLGRYKSVQQLLWPTGVAAWNLTPGGRISLGRAWSIYAWSEPMWLYKASLVKETVSLIANWDFFFSFHFSFSLKTLSFKSHWRAGDVFISFCSWKTEVLCKAVNRMGVCFK